MDMELGVNEYTPDQRLTIMWTNVFNEPRVYSPLDLVLRATCGSSIAYRSGALVTLGVWLRDDSQSFSSDEIETIMSELYRAFPLEDETEFGKFGLTTACEFDREFQRRQEAHACPDCGGDLREGVHQKQLDADWFYCEKSEDVKADYFEDDVPF
jgi:hypothetical protein